MKLNSWECLQIMLAGMEEQVARTDRFEIAHSNAELDRALAAGRTAIVHTSEGGHTLGAGLPEDDVEGHLERLRKLSDQGVASLTIAHLFPNDLAGHVDGIPKAEHKILFWPLETEVDLSRGLTEKGRAVVEEMVTLRMLPDVSHCTPIARKQIYELVADRIPIIASHTGVHSMNPVPYNLDQDDVAAITASGGLIGVIFMPYWLDSSNPGPGLDAIWRTMDTIHEWSGGSWDHVAIGTDFDGFTDPPDDCDSEAKLPKVADILRSKGLAATEVDAILGTNAHRVLRDGWL